MATHNIVVFGGDHCGPEVRRFTLFPRVPTYTGAFGLDWALVAPALSRIASASVHSSVMGRSRLLRITALLSPEA